MPAPRRRWAIRWDHWYRRVFPAYFVFLFLSTHMPRLRLEGLGRNPDKLAHFVAFGLLGFLLWRFAETFQRPLPGIFIWLAAPGLALYAAFDEWSQQFAGRGVELRDWLVGVGSAWCVLIALELHRRWRQPATPPSAPGPSDEAGER